MNNASQYPEVVAHQVMFDYMPWPHPSLREAYQPGTTEPWIANLIRALLLARGGHPNVLETGSFQGITSAWIALTLEEMGGGELTACDIEADRANAVATRLDQLELRHATWRVCHTDVLRLIADYGNKSLDLVFLDDDHTKHHVAQEIAALWPKMKSGGIMCFHDVWGSTDLQTIVKSWGGIALDFPRLGPAGGLGILQVP